MAKRTWFNKDGILCGTPDCGRKATWRSKGGPRCSKHKADNSIVPSWNPEHKRMYHWKYVGIDLTYKDYQHKLVDQDNSCMICGKDFSTMNCRPHVDHNHQTGQVRGLLCPRCNSLVEVIESGLVIKVQEYVDFWKSKY
jgi:DNA-directed RNA polymerase subunit RPC12/RpoP